MVLLEPLRRLLQRVVTERAHDGLLGPLQHAEQSIGLPDLQEEVHGGAQIRGARAFHGPEMPVLLLGLGRTGHELLIGNGARPGVEILPGQGQGLFRPPHLLYQGLLPCPMPGLENVSPLAPGRVATDFSGPPLRLLAGLIEADFRLSSQSREPGLVQDFDDLSFDLVRIAVAVPLLPAKQGPDRLVGGRARRLASPYPPATKVLHQLAEPARRIVDLFGLLVTAREKRLEELHHTLGRLRDQTVDRPSDTLEVLHEGEAFAISDELAGPQRRFHDALERIATCPRSPGLLRHGIGSGADSTRMSTNGPWQFSFGEPP